MTDAEYQDLDSQYDESQINIPENIKGVDNFDDIMNNIDYDALDAQLAGKGKPAKKPSKQSRPVKKETQSKDDDVITIGEDEEDEEVVSKDVEDDEDVENEDVEDVEEDEDVEDDEDSEEGLDDYLDPEKYDYDKLMVDVKIDGEDQRLPLSELKAGYQTQKASLVRMQRANDIENRTYAFMEQIMNPDKTLTILRKMGLPVDQIVDDDAARRYEMSLWSPKERELYEKEQRLAEMEEQYKAQEARLAREREQRFDQKFEAELKPQIQESMKQFGLPMKSRIYAKVLKTMEDYGSHGIELTPSQAVRLTRDELKDTVTSLFSQSEESELDRLVTKEQKLRVSKARGKNARKGRNTKRKEQYVNPAYKNAKKRGTEIRNAEDFFKNL